MSNYITKKIRQITSRISDYISYVPAAIFILLVSNLYLIVQGCYEIKSPWYDILVGTLVSAPFYFLVVYIPSFLHKKNIKDVFLKYYDQFKEDILREVLTLAEFDGDIHEKVQELKNTENFIVFFQQPSQYSNQNNWHVVMNNIDEKEHQMSLRLIVTKMSELQRELDFIIRTINVDSKDLLQKFRNLDRALQDGRYSENLDWNWGEDKRFTDSLYELLSGWSIVGGHHGDFIKYWIKKL